jgi:hypothetical protein
MMIYEKHIHIHIQNKVNHPLGRARPHNDFHTEEAKVGAQLRDVHNPPVEAPGESTATFAHLTPTSAKEVWGSWTQDN